MCCKSPITRARCHLLAGAPHHCLSLQMGVCHQRYCITTSTLLLAMPLLYLPGSNLCGEITFLQGHILPSPVQSDGTPAVTGLRHLSHGEELGAGQALLTPGWPTMLWL